MSWFSIWQIHAAPRTEESVCIVHYSPPKFKCLNRAVRRVGNPCSSGSGFSVSSMVEQVLPRWEDSQHLNVKWLCVSVGDLVSVNFLMGACVVDLSVSPVTNYLIGNLYCGYEW